MMKVLWLASWFPNKYEPFLGDFIERHAHAVSNFVTIHVIHVVQLGAAATTTESVQEYTIGNASVSVYSFAYKPLGISIIDKIRYNILYQLFYKKVLQHYEQSFGKPTCLHIHVPMKAGLVGIQMASRWKIPYFVSEHASMYEVAAKDHFHTRSKFFQKNTATIFKHAKAVSNVSATLGKTIQQLFALPKIQVIHNCVDTSLFYYQPKTNTEFTFIHVSSFHEQKNIASMLQAFESLQQLHNGWKLIMVGPVNSTIMQLSSVQALGEKIEFVGEINYASVAIQLQKAHAFVTFGLHENFPCAIIEALCCGVPVIASNVGGVAEAINDSNGILVPTNQQHLLLQALQNMLLQYQQFNRAIIANEAAKKYSYAAIGQQFANWYQQYL